MAKNDNLTDFVTDIADGFREKGGYTEENKIDPQNFRDYIENSPGLAGFSQFLGPLNWTKTLQNNVNEEVYCPAEGIDVSRYYDAATGKQLLPLIQFTVHVLDPLTGEGEVRVYDVMTDAAIGRLNSAVTEATYILPVFANLDTPGKYAVFPTFGMIATDGPTTGVRVQLTAEWVLIGDPRSPVVLSGSTLKGIN